MIESAKRKFTLLIGDLGVVIASGIATAVLRTGGHILRPQAVMLGVLFTAISSVVSFYVFGLYASRWSNSSKALFVRIVLAVCVTCVAVGWILFLITPIRRVFGPGTLLLQLPVSLCFTFVWRRFAVSLDVQDAKMDAVIWGAPEYAAALQDLVTSVSSPYRIVAVIEPSFLQQEWDRTDVALLAAGAPGRGRYVSWSDSRHDPQVEDRDKLQTLLGQTSARTIILGFSNPPTHDVLLALARARFQGVTVLSGTNVYEKLTGRVPVHFIGPTWLALSDGFELVSKDYIRRIKRITDLVIAVLIIAATAPIWLLTVLAIRAESKGSILFRQTRVGHQGATFELWKFRSMNENAENGRAQWAAVSDPRITRVGRLIRAMRIDELPQLVNVLKGEMSLIGPRPERPEFVALLEEEIPYYSLRHSVLPGITGWAQINFRYGASVLDALQKVEYDLYYIKNMSILLDLRIALRTIGVVLFGEGAR